MPDQSKEYGARLIAHADDIEAPRLRSLYLLWTEAAKDALPHPQIIDPINHAEESRSWIWLDVLSNGRDFQVRFVGTEFDNLVGQATTGLKFSQLEPVIGPLPLGRLREIADLVPSEGKPVLGGPRKTILPGKEFVTQRSLSLPFSTNGTFIDRILIAGQIDWTGK